MNNNRLLTMLIAVCLPLTTLLTGCTKESVSDCSNKFEFTVKAYVEGVEVGGSTVKEVTVYVFDHEQRFLKQIDAQINQLITLNYINIPNYTIVAIGNGKQGGVMLPQLSVGDPITSGIIRLKSTRATSYPIYPIPDDAFRGLKERIINDNSQSSTIVIPILRVMASVNITIKGLKEHYGVYEDNYSLVVRKTKSIFDFYGRLSGEDIGHSPSGYFNVSGVYTTSNFNILPTEPGYNIAIEIYNGTMLVTTIVADNNGNPMVPQAGKLLNILIDFSTKVQVNIITTPWGQVHSWKDWS